MRATKISPRSEYLLLVSFGLFILIVAFIGLFKTLGINVFSFFAKPQAQNSTQGTPFTGTINNLLSRGGKYSCTWDETKNSIHSVGTAYISGQDFAADADVMVSGFTVKANVIGNGKKFYIWTSFPGSKGTSVNYSDLEKTAESVSPQTDLLKQRLNFICNAWNPDSSKFSLPPEVKF